MSKILLKCVVSESTFSKNSTNRSTIINKKDIKSIRNNYSMKERTMPICFTSDQYQKIEQIAKQKGMLNPSQLLEEVLNEA
jgi:hypothetical protein